MSLAEITPLPTWKRLSLALFFALLLHLLFFSIKNLGWLLPALPPPPVSVEQLNPKQLEKIREKWKKKAEKQQSLLLDKNPNAPKEEKIPDNARYFSDRNIHVEKEQRARNMQPIPKPEQPQAQKPKTPPHAAAPRLKDLGISFHFDRSAASQTKESPTTAQNRAANQQKEAEPGGDQSILDKNLPVGGENLLNAQESVYYSFYARLHGAIAPLWLRKARASSASWQMLQPGDYETVIEAILDKDGNLIRTEILQSSGVEEFDKNAKDPWHEVQRFPNPPQGLLDSQGLVHIPYAFRISLGKSSGLQFNQPERIY